MNETMLPRAPQDYSVMYVDMNAFFASVAQQERPELRGRPVAVSPCIRGNCSVIAASYEARAFGVQVGTKLQRAAEVCPGIQVVSDEPSLYRSYNARIMDILRDTYCQVGVRSIDEAYLLVPSYARTRDDVLALSKAIKKRINAELGEYIKCSIGVGPNIWLAKMAAGSQKPDGEVILTLDRLKGFYKGLPLVACTGIGRRMARRLYAVGVSDTADLASRSLPSMRSWFGLVGQKWYLRLRGYEVDQDSPLGKQRQTISHQVTVLGNRQLHGRQSRQYVLALATRLGARLRSYGLLARGIGLYVAYSERPGVHVQYPAGPCLAADSQIIELALRLLDEVAVEEERVRLFALYLTGLTSVEQLALPLDSNGEGLRDASLSKAVDVLSARFGRGVVVRAAVLNKGLVPDRIGFGRS